MTLFRTDFSGSTRPTDPESLFRDLKRAPHIKHLWSHQADILRTYHTSHLGTSDVALEVPTGTGKTLIGLLIGEFRRRLNDERVVYLTPNKMLANQVAALAVEYGIPTHVLVGRQSEYPIEAFHEYTTNQAIAITSYSGVFNTNPRLNDAHVILLDDAHASENYIADLWSVGIGRKKHPDIWKGLIGLYATYLPEAFADRLRSEESDPKYDQQVDIIPGPYMRKHARELRELLNAHLSKDDAAYFPWSVIEPYLHACNIFFTWGAATIRPVIPPTHLHLPFSSALQRIYMSATLGEGGELERIVGVRSISRIPVPKGWDTRGSGRRLFIMPGLSLKEPELTQGSRIAITLSKRGLVLTPNDSESDRAANDFSSSGFIVYRAKDIEKDLSAFTAATNAVLVLANRYDGIDLPDEECRLLLVHNLPIGTNLQERFLFDRLAATSLLRDRMITRLTQAVGRCTRSDNDYAVVLLYGQELIDFVSRSDTRNLLHPELQAELEFGLNNSTDTTFERYTSILRSFLAQDTNWHLAEGAIQKARKEKHRKTDPEAVKLREVVTDEIDYIRSLWKSDYRSALMSARKVADALGGPRTKGYRAWWYYLAADAAMLDNEVTGDEATASIGRELFERACKASPAIVWLAELARHNLTKSPLGTVEKATVVATDAIHKLLKDLGTFGVRFEKDISACREKLSSKDHNTFVQGLRRLGDYLGFESTAPKETGAPDCIWTIQGTAHIAFEAKPEQKPEEQIGIESVRQTAGHEKWTKASVASVDSTPIISILITPRTKIDKDAVVHAGSTYHVTPASLQSLGEETIELLRKTRSLCTSESDEGPLEAIRRELIEALKTPDEVVRRLTTRKLSTLERRTSI